MTTHPASSALKLTSITTILLLAGCRTQADPAPVTCGPGTMLSAEGTCVVDPDGAGVECSAGQRLDPATGVCTAFDPCADVDCGTYMPPGAATVAAQLVPGSANACMCAVTTCADGWSLAGAGCVAAQACAPGYRQEGALCVPQDDVSCYEAPASPLCIPTRCAEQPTSFDGQDLRALGKCVEDPPPPVESCTNNCHNGIEDSHPWFGGADLTCTGCHGGDASANTREQAHVPLPSAWQANSPQFGRPNLRYYYNYVTLQGVHNHDGGLEWLRFINPADLRVADQSCGRNSSCHADRVEYTRRSAMALTPGLSGVANRRSGVARSVRRGEDALYKWDTTEGYTTGAGTLQAIAYDATISGSVQRIGDYASIDREQNGAYSETDLLVQVFDKVCGNCHLNSKGGFNFGQRYADFRGSGCGSCHVSYALDGRSRSRDQMIPKTEPTYPAAYAAISNFNANDLQNLNGAWLGPERAHPTSHRLTKAIASQRCGSCHFGSNRTDWQYRGYRFDPNRDAVQAIANGRINASQIQFTDEIDNDTDPFARYHGAAQNQVLKFEDWDNDGQDDTPADVHYIAGLECIDCHTSAEMHNELKFVKVKSVTDWHDPSQVLDMSGAIWSQQDKATEVECVHCHGNLEYRALPFAVDNRNVVKNLVACAEVGEQLLYDDDHDPSTPEVPYDPPECGTLGAGRWLKGKYSGRWHYLTQVRDTVNLTGSGAGGGVVRPNGGPVYTLNASIFHGRYNNDLADGAGPCPGGDINNCFKDQSNPTQQVSQGFSHLGQPARSPVDQHAGGLECYSCHSTWIHGCFGCHLATADTDGTKLLRDYSRSTGELTLGALVQANFGYVDPLAIQLGINSEGKIAQMNPMEKLFIRHIDSDNNDYFGTRTQVNADANIAYNIYRDRAGFGTRQYATERVGLPLNADGPLFEQYAEMDDNAGQGFNQIMPHTIQRSWGPLMDCNACHLDANETNRDAVLARYGANPNGFANVSTYLIAMDGLAIDRNFDDQFLFFDKDAGFRFDQDTDPGAYVVDIQSDWVVREDGFPLSYNNHPLRRGVPGLYFDPSYARAWPAMAEIAGPLNQGLLSTVLNVVRNANEGVPFKQGRR
ncbi:MAG: cytochrome c [Deltaproteobacteria bacterium]|nr:cytochrome c [Deltaproteobacteria bacterium]